MKFTYRGPLKSGSSLFQGRRDEANTLLDACQKDVEAYQIIYGSRQSGKTSLLLNIKHRLPSEVLACRIDFQSLQGASTEEVLQFMADEIVTKIRDVVVDYPLWRPGGSGRLLFGKWLERLPLKGRLVMLLEELGSLSSDTRIDLAAILRSVFTARYDSYDTILERIMFIFSGGIELFDMLAKEGSPLQNVCDKIYLPDLNSDQTIQLLKAGFQGGEAKDSQLDFETLGQAIYCQVEGHPYLSQRLGELVLTRLLKNDNVSYTQVVDELSSELLEHDDHYDRYFGYLYNTIQHYQLTEACRQLLSEPSQYSTAVGESMMRLRLLGVAKEHGKQWAVRNPLLKRGLEQWLANIPSFPPLIPPSVKIEAEAYLAYQNDMKVLIDFLINHLFLTNEDGRKAVIIQAGLTALLPSLSLHGPSTAVIPSLIWSLEQHDHVLGKSSALGLFLGALAKPQFGGIDTQQFLEEFINRYHLL